MYYCVMALLQTIGEVPRKHQGAMSLFDREFVHKGLLHKDLSADLHRAFEVRQEDDYLRLEPVPLDDANSMLTAAERFLKAVREYLSAEGLLHET